MQWSAELPLVLAVEIHPLKPLKFERRILWHGCHRCGDQGQRRNYSNHGQHYASNDLTAHNGA